MQGQTSAAWLVADFFTHSHRISGRVHVRHRNLADQLNDQNTSFLTFEDAYVSSIERPAEITTSYPALTLRKNNVTAIVVVNQDDGLPREHTYGSYFGTNLHRVFVTVPQFEIEGYLRIAGRWDMRTVLTSGTDDFVTVLDGQMQSAIRPDTTFTGGAILVNKAHVGAICKMEE